MEKLRIMSVFGTRPEAIKMAPLVKELASRDEIESLCCVTAQHREMLDSVMEVFDLKADCDLDIMTPRQTLSTITSKCLLGMDDAIEQLKPDMILVHGDTSTTFAGALSAFYHKVPVGHVEAGLRTYDKYSPFPEEMNRKLVTAIADLYFCPTKNNRENLLKEGVTEGLFITGNTVIDALKTTVCKDYHFTTELLDQIKAKGIKIAHVTLHVGLGTFRPVKEENILDHHMHSEFCIIEQDAADMINETKATGGRVVSVGTTSTRTLESMSDDDGTVHAGSKWTDIFIYPGYKFKVIDALITNFHLPESTLLMLVSALYDREHILEAYKVAVEEKYRFFSFGDAMLIK